MTEPVEAPTRRYVDVALGLLGVDEAAELILRTVSIVVLIGIHFVVRIAIYRSTDTTIDTNTVINTGTTITTNTTINTTTTTNTTTGIAIDTNNNGECIAGRDRADIVRHSSCQDNRQALRCVNGEEDVRLVNTWCDIGRWYR